MEQADLKREYDDTLASYTHRRSESNFLEKDIAHIRDELQRLRLRLNQPQPLAEPQPHTAHLQLAQKEHQDLQARYLALEGQLHALQAENGERVGSYAHIIQQHHHTLSEIQTKRKSATFVVDTSSTQQAQHALETSRQKVAEEAHKIEQLKRDIEAEERLLEDLHREIEQLQQAKNSRPRVEDVNSTVDLENELAALEREEHQLGQEARSKQASHQQARHREQSENKHKLAQLQQLKHENSQTKAQIQKINAELASLKHNDRNEALEKEIKGLEEVQKTTGRDIEALTKQAAAKKQQEAAKKQEAKKDKNKDKRNFKQEIVEEQKLTEILHRELEREKNKLEETVKLRKTYVSNDNLQILQKEYERHQIKNKPSLQAEQAKREKVLKEREIIKLRIDFLKKSIKGLENDNQKVLKDLRVKGDELVKEKLASQKVLNQTTYKLNEYMKEFPDHEKKKQEAKNEEKRRRHEAKVKAQEEKEKEAHRKSQLKKEQRQAAEAEASKPESEKWDEWDKANNLPKRDEKSLFNNKQFQLIAAAVAVVLILTLSLS